MARWHVYEVPPIDFNWMRLSTVKELAKTLGEEHAMDRLSGPNMGMEPPGLDEFIAAWETAQQLARDKGWEGDFRNEPAVFWVPGDTEFTFGFVIKQDNNGTTYVVSPVALPHLAD